MKKELERLAAEKAPGPLPSFSIFHMLHAIELIAEKKCGRIKLSEKLKLGEGATRTLLNRLKEAGIIVTSKAGCKLTERGRQLWKQYKAVFKKRVQLEKNELTLAQYNIALLVRDKEEKVKSGMEQRDAALLCGGKGAITLVYKNGKLTIPSVDLDVAEAYPKAHRQLMTFLEPEENDVIIIGCADTEEKAVYGTLAAAWTLLDDC